MTEVLLKELKNKGITIKVISNGKLWLGPKSKLTPELIARVRKHKAEIIKALQCKPQPEGFLWKETNSLFQASLLKVERCYIRSAIEKALKRDEVCSAFEALDRVWRGVLEGKEDIASFKRALEEWETILLSNLKEFV